MPGLGLIAPNKRRSKLRCAIGAGSRGYREHGYRVYRCGRSTPSGRSQPRFPSRWAQHATDLWLLFLQLPPALRAEAREVKLGPTALRRQVAARGLARRRACRTVAAHALIRRAIAVCRIAALLSA